MGVVLVATFAGLVLIRLLAVVTIAFFVIRPVDACPACFSSETLPIRHRLLRVLGSRYQWRWCPQCGWQALVSSSAPTPQIKEARSS